MDKVIHEETHTVQSQRNIFAQVIYLAYTIVAALLIIRFALIALGANAANGFADFIYDVSRPLVSPFYNLFSNDFVYGDGNARFDWETLFALVIYTIVMAILLRIAALGPRSRDV